MAFLRNLLAVLVGMGIFTGMAISFFVIFVFTSAEDQTYELKENSVLHLKLSGVIQERVVEDPFQELFGADGPKPLGLYSLLEAINNAAEDTKIKGIYMEHGFLSAGYSSLDEVREALISFKESGKFLYSYGEYLSEGDYYLASVADSIFLNHEGALEINGLSANVTFYKGTFDKLGIEPQIFRVGEFKSYVEPYIREDLSEANRLQLTELLNAIYRNYSESVSAERLIDVDKFKNISDQMLVQLPQDAVNLGLVSRLAYKDEVKSLLRSELGIESDDKINFVSLSNYSTTTSPRFSGSYKNKVALIVADGSIVMGSGSENVAGEKFAKEIRKARENDKVKAIVLRVNSPGGSLTASDIIWREVMLTKGVKPIIASMGDVAASGGYFISMPCDTIVAQPNTITGSIGIFGMLFNLENFLEDKLGITHDVVRTGEYSDIMTVTRPLSDAERAIIQKGVNKGYDTFISKASQGRNMSEEDMLKVASGRVWTGEQAFDRGLVDVLGDLDDAILIAAGKAGLEEGDFKVSIFPEKKPFIEEFLEGMNAQAKAAIQDDTYGELGPYLEKIKELQNYQGIQARMPFDFEIR
ncbi:MAG: signal peptide peptidase SppA [bacterium]|nr:signal peptide peptidase SppA [bacterium]